MIVDLLFCGWKESEGKGLKMLMRRCRANVILGDCGGVCESKSGWCSCVKDECA